MIISRSSVISTALFTLAWHSIAFSQQPVSTGVANRSVMLTATVKTAGGNHAIGLPKDAFQVIDGKTAMPVDDVEGGDYPASIGILIDTSSSVELFEPKRLDRLGEAIERLLQDGHQSNEYFIAAFDADLRMLADWKSAAELISQKVAIGPNKRNTAMYDACFTALEHFRSAKHDRKALIVISDGQDGISRHSFNQLRELLKQADVIFYGILSPTQSADIGSSLGIEGASILSELSDITAGAQYSPHNDRELSHALNMIATEVRHQYRIRFHVDSSEPANRWHRIKVRVDTPPNAPADFKKLKVRVRSGYYTS
jgi:Ca-activated chloride channel homolog